jgi:hypothetical protein
MIFNELLQNINSPNISPNIDPKSISVYPIGENNLEGIKVLIDNCYRMGNVNNNIQVATMDPLLWLGEFLDKHWNKISYVSSLPSFSIMKVEDNKIVSRQYNCLFKEFNSDGEINDFFEKNKWKTFVIFVIIKHVNLVNLSSTYRVRYADITEKYEERENKLEEILK